MSDSEPLPIGESVDIICHGWTWRLRHDVAGVGMTAITLTHVCGNYDKCCNSTPLIFDPTREDWDRCVELIMSGVQRFIKNRGVVI